MRQFIVAGMLVFGSFVEAGVSQQGKTVFDRFGHLIAYAYPDGTRDLYTYDSSWRMVSFTGHDHRKTRYYYKPDGTMVTVTDVR